MPLLHLTILALIQGITEFLPISSSGHLILFPELTGAEDQGVAIDIAVHVGTLGAVVLYFRADVGRAAAGALDLVRFRTTPGAYLALMLVVATIPAVLFGLVLSALDLTDALRSMAVIGWTMLGFGVLLYIIDTRWPMRRTAADWTLRHALIMGLWQMLALIPGTSRSGITITGARALGYDREEGARFAMLMSIPIILAAALVIATDIEGWRPGLWRDAGIAAGLAFASALVALAVMMRLTRQISFTPYVIYRVVLGLILLGIAYS